MRALVVTLSLAMIVAFLVGILVIFGGVRVDETILVLFGGGLFMVAVLFAAISAIGPKFRPTPALTPIMAGTSAATFTSALILAAHLHLSAGQAASFRAGEPQRAAPEATEPVPEARTVEPEAPDPPDAFASVSPAEEEPVGDVSGDDVPMDEPPIEGLPMDIPTGEPSETAALPSADPMSTTDPAIAPGSAPVPIPVPRPRSPSETPEKLEPGETFTLSDQPFDSSTITAAPRGSRPSAAPPPSTAPITPPLPRSRPCGAGGPPCP
jgi:hypothetical protein